MAPKSKKKIQAKKVKKKRWISILAPKIFNNFVLGETHVTDQEEVARKKITLNLMTVMNDMRKQGYMISFKVISVKDLQAQTALTGLTMTPAAVKRLIRRGRDKVDDSFIATLRTGQKVRVKPVIITANCCSKDAQTQMRLAVREKLKTMLLATTLDDFVRDVIDIKAQRVLKEVANQTHPVRTADIRGISLITTDKLPAEADETPAETVETSKPALPDEKVKASKPKTSLPVEKAEA